MALLQHAVPPSGQGPPDAWASRSGPLFTCHPVGEPPRSWAPEATTASKPGTIRGTVPPCTQHTPECLGTTRHLGMQGKAQMPHVGVNRAYGSSQWSGWGLRICISYTSLGCRGCWFRTPGSALLCGCSGLKLSQEASLLIVYLWQQTTFSGFCDSHQPLSWGQRRWGQVPLLAAPKGPCRDLQPLGTASDPVLRASLGGRSR